MILLTGSNGFLGQIICQYLSHFNIITLSRTKADVICDLAVNIPTLPQCDIIIHAAGKAHSVPRTHEEEQDFFNVNVKGTANLLLSLERMKILPKSFVYISSVSVYGCESGEMIDENHFLGARDPYGVSKIEAEKLVQGWCSRYKLPCIILRLPLLIGRKPPGNLGAMIKGIKKKYYFNVANGCAKKSMVLASDVAKLIPEIIGQEGIYNLTDGYHPSFREISSLIAGQLGKGNPRNIPLWLAKIVAFIGDIFGERSPINRKKLSKITSHLTFDDSSARKNINWRPNCVLDEFEIK